MGYSTTFKGKLRGVFSQRFSKKVVEVLTEKVLGEDIRDSVWLQEQAKAAGINPLDIPHLTYIDLEFNEDETAIEWDGSEKSYYMPEKIALVVYIAKQSDPTFQIYGEFKCYGEDPDDRWLIYVKENRVFAHKAIIHLEPEPNSFFEWNYTNTQKKNAEE